MKKPILVAIAAALLTGPAFSQIPDHSVAPDWTATDLNGQTHHLYSLLDSGYTVFLDVSATWCPPCWSYHNSGAMENLYLQYGPGTAENKVRVFMIEGDPSTTIQDLYQAGPNSQGDWVTGTPYPIIDNAAIANGLQITYFPTIFKICPNRIVTEIGQKTTSQLWNSVSSCWIATQTNDPGLLPIVGEVAGCAGAPMDLVARMQNVGTQPLTSATIQVRRGNEVLGSVDWTGNLDTYDIEEVVVASYTPTGNSQVTFEITSADDNSSNNSRSQLVKASQDVAHNTQVTFEIKTDQYGTETRWKLYSPDGSVFAQGGPYTNTPNPQVNTYNWVLEDASCYKLQVTDAYGDGMCCSYGNGYFKVIANGQTVLQGGQFTDVINKYFRVEGEGAGIVENELGHSLNVYPNPTTGRVDVEFSLTKGTNVKATITDLVGKVVLERTLGIGTGLQRETFDLGNLSDGMYLLTLDAGNQRATRTITLNK